MNKSILFYGDSNTWGSNGDTATSAILPRIPRELRYTGVLQNALIKLGIDCDILDEGLPGRTTALDDPLGEYKNGKRYILPCVLSHAPLDLVVIMLGTNDTQLCYEWPAVYSAAGIRELIRLVRFAACGTDPKTKNPEILIISPIHIGDQIANSPLGDLFNDSSIASTKLFCKFYSQIALEEKCIFIDAAKFASASDDGVHMDISGHTALGLGLLNKIKGILAD